MSDPSRLVHMPLSRWLSVPEGPPQEVWESALSKALEAAAPEEGAESAADDPALESEEAAGEDVVAAWDEDAAEELVRHPGEDLGDPTDGVDDALTTWDGSDGGDGS